MAKIKRRGLPTKWSVIAGVTVVFLIVVFSAWKTSPPIQQLKSGAYQLYQNTEYKFSIQHPNNWDVKSNTQVFENGDAIAFRISGPAHKKYTELADGAQLAISKPFEIDTDLTMWIKSYFSDQAKLSKLPLNNYEFEVVEDCKYMECMRYYFTKIDGHVYGVALYAEGASPEKAAYENSLIYMLKSLQFESLDGTRVPTGEVIKD